MHVRPLLSRYAVILVATSMQLLLQFALQALLAYRFGAERQVDLFQAALVITATINTMLQCSLSYVLIPLLSQHFAGNRSPEQGWRLACVSGCWIALLAAAISAALLLGSATVTSALYPGLEPDDRQLTARLLSILSGQVLFGTLFAWLQSLQHAQSRFAWPAGVGILGAGLNLWLAHRWSLDSIVGYSWALLVSQAAQALLLLIPSLPGLLTARTLWDRQLPQMWQAWWPLVVGGSYIRFEPLVDRMVVAWLPIGALAHLGYSQRFLTALLALTTGGLLTVIFPSLSGAADHQELGRRIGQGLRLLTLLLIPLVIGGGLYAPQVVADLLERGAFAATDTLQVSRLLRILMLVLLAASIADLLARSFYSIGDTRTPTVVCVVLISFSILAKWWTVPYGGLELLCWISVAYQLLVLICLGVLLRRRLEAPMMIGLPATLGRALLASLLATAAAWPIVHSLPRWGWLVALPASACTYLAGLWLSGERLTDVSREEPQ